MNDKKSEHLKKLIDGIVIILSRYIKKKKTRCVDHLYMRGSPAEPMVA